MRAGGYTICMPPQESHSPIPNPNEDRLLPPHQRSSFGPVVGIIIIVIVVLLGALYFWGALLNAKNSRNAPLPFIPGDATTTIIEATTSTTTAQ
jgi:hypothetical protein